MKEIVVIKGNYGNGKLYVNPNAEPMDIDPDTIDWVQIKPITSHIVFRKVKQMKLKHGKKYETADGVVLKVFAQSSKVVDWIAFESFDDPCAFYDFNGVARGLPDYYNLIRRHYTKPKPAHKLDLKPGDVVELVAWEDGSTHGIGKRYPFDGFPNEPKGERPLFRVVSRS
jgi:hypothetical protein